jgi:uncharacterized damage-inducible protein DinB
MIGTQAERRERKGVMDSQWTIRPETGECAEFYQGYLARVPEGDIRTTLALSLEQTLRLLWEVPVEREGFAYAPGRWTVKEIVGHLVDVERIFAYRALRFGRGDETPLTGFEQDDYVRRGGFEARTLADLASEFEHLRRANLLLFRGFAADVLSRKGVASGREVTVRALLWIMAGHELHHADILRERYLAD